MRGIVPDAILDRRDKIGFATPEATWFEHSGALRSALARVAERPLPGCFSPAMRDRLKTTAQGRAPYGAEIWRSWNALRWAELLRLDFPA